MQSNAASNREQVARKLQAVRQQQMNKAKEDQLAETIIALTSKSENQAKQESPAKSNENRPIGRENTLIKQSKLMLSKPAEKKEEFKVS